MPEAPVHQEIETPPPLRRVSFFGSVLAFDAIIITAWLCYNALIYSRLDAMAPSGVSTPAYISGLAYLAIPVLLLPAFLRVGLNARRVRRALDGVIERRYAAGPPEGARVFWRRNAPDGSKVNGAINPTWRPATIPAPARSEPRELEPPVRTPAREGWKTIALLTLATTALTAAVINFAGVLSSLLAAVPGGCMFVAAYLHACPTPFARRRVRILPGGLQLASPRGAARDVSRDDADLIVLGTHHNHALCALRDRETGRHTRFSIRAADLGTLVAAVTADAPPTEAALASNTVTTSTGAPLPNAPPIDRAPPIIATKAIASICFAGVFFAMITNTLISISRISRSARTGATSGLLSSYWTTLLILLGVVALAMVGAGLWAMRDRRRFDRAVRRAELVPGAAASPIAPAPRTLASFYAWNAVDLPRRVEPNHEETVLTPHLSFWQHPAPVLLGGIPVLIVILATGSLSVSESIPVALGIMIGGVTIVAILSPTITIRSLTGRHPRIDAIGIELPRFRGEPERFAWHASTLLVLGDHFGATRCRVIDNTDHRNAEFTVSSRDLPLLLGAVAAHAAHAPA